ncbi:MAG: hypothetical protein COB56_03170 [Robiginitomaculum sp.]|nr:MAG: hypothetical protein COB56_03170 [Robiginitomaculum sp.]
MPISMLWHKLKHLFNENDGSLPEIELNFNNFTDVEHAFSILKCLSGENTEYILSVENHIVSIQYEDNSTKLCANSPIGTSHIMFNDIKSINGKPIPSLGVGFWENGLVFDYCMAEIWNAQSLEIFFEILLKLSKLPTFKNVSTPLYNEEDSMLFWSAWEAYRSNS